MQIICLQHMPYEGPGAFADWASSRGHTLRVHRFYDPSARLPEPERFGLIVVLGGPMGANDDTRYPWFAEELGFIERGIRAGKPVVGVCLGAQLAARVLGASVRRNPETEIGWFPVRLTDEGKAQRLLADLPPDMEAFHWHGDTFELPDRAVRLWESEACRNQGFLFRGAGPVLGLQFHLESTKSVLRELIAANRCDLAVGGDWVQPETEILARGEYFYIEMNRILYEILDRLDAESLLSAAIPRP